MSKLNQVGFHKFIDKKGGKSKHKKIYTGLPTKDETSETTVQNSFSPFSKIQDYLLAKTCLLKYLFESTKNVKLQIVNL